jgi:hypothetical protein
LLAKMRHQLLRQGLRLADLLAVKRLSRPATAKPTQPVTTMAVASV